MARLFVGVSLPPNVVQDAALTQSGIRGARWVASENLHLTTAFFGDVEYRLCDKIIEALDDLEYPSFDARIQGCGVFPHRGPPRQLWLGVDTPRAFMGLRDAALQPLRSLARHIDDRKYHPHVTIARMGRCSPAHLHRWIEGHASYRSESFRVDRLSLFISQRESGRASYTELARFRLAASSHEAEDEYGFGLATPGGHTPLR